jgi:hypothetical protein
LNKPDVKVSQPTVSDFIVKNKTYVKALNMANSEAFKKFQDPPRTFPKKEKKLQKSDMDSEKQNHDKNASEHSKALNTFGGLLGYYKEREN